GRLVATRRLAGRGVDAQFLVEPDDTALVADGADMTRVVLRVTDDFGGPRPLATGAVALALEGPGALVGENPFALVGGVGAVWVRAGESAGTLTLRAAHPILGARAVTIQVVAPPPAPL
ncbi:MAG TPA: hypothetical protein VFW96_10635, partial [Thermomicrobiales bacterium]|nr:hypothetical protein [Thermomicrobiales bacterium]